MMKGQGWNLVEALKDPATGPIDLAERPRAVVWEEVVTVLVKEKGMAGVGSRGEEDELGNVGTASEMGPAEDEGAGKATVSEQASEGGDNDPADGGNLVVDARDVTEEERAESASSPKETKREKWHDRFRNHIRLGFGRSREDKAGENVERKATIVVERVEIVPNARPCFTCC